MIARPFPRTGLVLGILVLLAAPGCAVAPDNPIAIVDAAIQTHGGDRFDNSRIRFTFRGVRFEYFRDAGVFRYERTYRDPLNRTVSEVMWNDGTSKSVDGAQVELTPAERERVEYDLNSVIYFGFLPFRLRDPGARLATLVPDTVRGEPYYRVEVTFDAENGGVDSDVRFVHWIHQESHTLDYFSYRYSRDGGGVRFRRAVNRREIGGILLQDWENFGPAGEVTDIATLSRDFEGGTLDLLSVVAFEDVEVERARGVDGSFGTDPLLPPEAPGEGLELQLGIERFDYAPGDSIRVVLNLVNRSGSPLTLDFPTAQRLELSVLDGDGTELSRWSEGRQFDPASGAETLAPDSTFHVEGSVPAPREPGEYLLQGSLPAVGTPLPTALPFRVLP